MTTSTQHFPQFAELKRYSLAFVRPDAPPVRRIDHHSTTISSNFKSKVWKEKPESPVTFMQLEYTWSSSIPDNWRKLSKRQFVNRREKAKFDSVQFLSETQKFIHWMRRPDDQKPVRRVIRKSSQPSTTLFIEEQKPEPLRLTPGIQFMGDIEGDLRTAATKIPMTRPNTTQSKSSHPFAHSSFKTHERPQRPQSHLSAIFHSSTSGPHIARSISVTVMKKGSICMIESQTDEVQADSSGKDREVGSRRSHLLDLSLESQWMKPLFPTKKTEASPFEIWLNGAEGRVLRRSKQKKRN